MPQSTRPRLFLVELELDRRFSYLVLDDPVQKYRVSGDLSSPVILNSLLVWEFDLRVLRFHVIHELFETVEERDHGYVEASIMQQAS